MTDFDTFYERALQRVGSTQELEERLPKGKSRKQLIATPDDRYLAEMAACIFRSGFVWRVIEKKWDGFEEVFNGFLPIWVASRSPEDIEEMARDTRIVRNLTKVKAVQDNALFVLDIQREHGSFGQFLADWPEDDIVGLWQTLKKQGSRLGGNSGQYFLRFVGKDTFILSRDVCQVLLEEKVIDKNNPSSQRDQRKVQDFFNQLRQDSGRSLAELSRLLALTVG